ncbi:hypothetical protein BCR35DRAFT_329389 [Leucosporidium creatinivorum]|uniref:Uncharacterized protein n=1 Tax=Leucosporidium creatinivorum TaxID=106004 RepID=A0A1Y2FZ96_9BASI|nr:hypothetical protein BCR35DRAFT_329389 [Leucosporidium creatinivorum]
MVSSSLLSVQLHELTLVDLSSAPTSLSPLRFLVLSNPTRQDRRSRIQQKLLQKISCPTSSTTPFAPSIAVTTSLPDKSKTQEQRATALYLSRLSRKWRKYAEPFIYKTLQLSYRDPRRVRMLLRKLDGGWSAKEVRRVLYELSPNGEETVSPFAEHCKLLEELVVRLGRLDTLQELCLTSTLPSWREKWPPLLEAEVPTYNLTCLSQVDVKLPFPYLVFSRLRQLSLGQLWFDPHNPLDYQCFPALEELSVQPSILDYDPELPNALPAVNLLRAIVPQLRILRINASDASPGFPFDVLVDLLLQGSNLFFAVKCDYGSEMMDDGSLRDQFFGEVFPWDVCREVLKVRRVQKLAGDRWWDSEWGSESDRLDSGWLVGEFKRAQEELKDLGVEVEVRGADHPIF